MPTWLQPAVRLAALQAIFGLDETTMNRALNDYLWGHCAIEQTAYDVTPASLVARQGSIHLIPSSGVPVAGIFPLSEEMLQLGSGGVFCLQYPEHPFTDQVRQVAGQILA